MPEIRIKTKKDNSPQVFLSNQTIVIFCFPFVFFFPLFTFYLNIGFSMKTMHWKYVVEKIHKTGSFFLSIITIKRRVGSRSCGITVHHMCHNCSSYPTEDGTEKADLSSRYNVLVVLSCLSHVAGWCICTDLQLWVEGEDREHSPAQGQAETVLLTSFFCWEGALSNFTNYHITYVHSTLQGQHYIGGLG